MSADNQAAIDLVVGLEYDETPGAAPKISLKGNADDSSFIVAQAARFGVPVVEDPHVAAALHEVPLDAEIPEELYRAVAVILNSLNRA